MSVQLPPELMAPEEREQRAAELKREIGREWIFYVVVDLLLGATGVVLLFYAKSRAAHELWFVAIAGGYFVLTLVALQYWLRARIRPRGAQLDRLQGGEA